MKSNRLVFTIVCLNLLISAACAQVKPVLDGNPKPITFSNADFVIDLGADWKLRDTNESFEWEDEKNMQEIIISVLTAQSPMNSELRITTAKRLMGIRQKSINEISEGKAVLSKVETNEGDETIELTVIGVDKTYGMQIYNAVIVHPTRAVTFSYYKYSPLFMDEAFLIKSKEMRSTLKVR